MSFSSTTGLSPEFLRRLRWPIAVATLGFVTMALSGCNDKKDKNQVPYPVENEFHPNSEITIKINEGYFVPPTQVNGPEDIDHYIISMIDNATGTADSVAIKINYQENKAVITGAKFDLMMGGEVDPLRAYPAFEELRDEMRHLSQQRQMSTEDVQAEIAGALLAGLLLQ